MNAILRRLKNNCHLIPAALTGYLLLKGWQPQLPGWECPFRALTGIPSPGCFLTRATSAALTGQLDRSIELHLFGPIVAATLVIWSIASIRTKRLIPKQPSLPAVSIAISALFSYWLLRMFFSYILHFDGFPGFPSP